MVDRSSLDGLFRPLAMHEVLAPPQGRPHDMISNCSLLPALDCIFCAASDGDPAGPMWFR